MRVAREKIKTVGEMKPIREGLRGRGLKLVFTNGCFDLLHPGHVRYLQKARTLGDALLVALNDDASVRALKGAGRPILDQSARSEVIAALECVDWVTVFGEETPLTIIQELLPDVLAKGGDWSLDRIVGRETVESAGGKVVSIQFEEGHSTSRIIDKIRSAR